MISPLLALFIRSLREDNRARLTYFSRAGLVLIIMLFLYVTQTSLGWSNAPGLRFFNQVIFTDLLFIMLAGCSHFAAAICEEKEELTLGLLRMTNLNPLSILLGKSTSRLIGALLLLAAQFPFTLLAITLGGISMPQILAAYCTLGAFLIFVSNLALLASVVCRRTSAAAALVGGWLFGFFAVVPAASWLANLPVALGLHTSARGWVTELTAVADFAKAASPFTRLQEIFRTGFSGSPAGFQVTSNLAFGAVCFLLAWACFDLFCSEQQESAGRGITLTRRTSLLRVFSAGRAWRLALAWKDFYFIAGGKFWLLLRVFIYAVPLVSAHFWPKALGGAPSWDELGAGIIWFGCLFLGVELAFAAATIFRVEHQRQTLSSLAMLPQGIRRVAYQKLLGAVPPLLPALCFIAVGLGCVMPTVWGEIKNWHLHELPKNELLPALLLVGYLGANSLLFLHLVANLSLRIKRGALPVAIGAFFIVNFFGGFAMAAMISSYWSMLPIALAALGGAVALHFDLGRRLETLAAEE